MTEPVSPPAAHGSSPSTALAARESLGACARHTSGQLALPAPVWLLFLVMLFMQ